MSNVVVLGIDGIEYDLVEEWGLKHLKQEAYCKTSLEDFNVVVTPVIWSSMITGKIYREIEEAFERRIRMFGGEEAKKGQYTWSKKLMEMTPDWLKKIAKPYARRLEVFFPNPFDATADYLQKNNISTIFDECDSWNNGIPALNLNVSPIDGRKAVEQYIVHGNKRPLFRYARRNHMRDIEELNEVMNNSYELIFWYTKIIDTLGHHLPPLKMMDYYLSMNKIAGEISKKCDKLYIISDHGMKKRSHSDHGFFSSSTGDLVERPQDLYHLLLKECHNE